MAHDCRKGAGCVCATYGYATVTGLVHRFERSGSCTLLLHSSSDECKTFPGGLSFRADGLAFIKWNWLTVYDKDGGMQERDYRVDV